MEGKLSIKTLEIKSSVKIITLRSMLKGKKMYKKGKKVFTDFSKHSIKRKCYRII